MTNDLTDEVLAELERRATGYAGIIISTEKILPLIAAARRYRELEAELRIIGHKLYALNELAKATVFRYNKGVLDELLRRIETLVQMEPTQ